MGNYFDKNNYYYQETQRQALDKIKKNAELRQLNSDNNANQLALIGLHAQIRNYKALLSKPMEEIAAQNGDFKATFEKQQEIIADWIVSQKAFRELAIDLGEEFGVSKETMREKYSEKIKAVLTDSTKHGNDASENMGRNILVELTEKTIATEKAKIGL